jgi:hypothetical protein
VPRLLRRTYRSSVPVSISSRFAMEGYQAEAEIDGGEAEEYAVRPSAA